MIGLREAREAKNLQGERICTFVCFLNKKNSLHFVDLENERFLPLINGSLC